VVLVLGLGDKFEWQKPRGICGRAETACDGGGPGRIINAGGIVEVLRLPAAASRSGIIAAGSINSWTNEIAIGWRVGRESLRKMETFMSSWH